MLLVLALLAYGGLPSNPPAAVAMQSEIVVAIAADMPGERYIAPTQVKEYRSRLTLADEPGHAGAIDAPAGPARLVPPLAYETIAFRQAAASFGQVPDATCNGPRAPPLAA